MQVGFVDLGSGKYYLDATGAMKTGWILVDGNWYWAYPSGALASSWQTIGGTRYYFDSQTLAMFKGRHEIEIIPGSVNELPASDRNTIRAVIPIYSIFEPSIYEAIVAKNAGWFCRPREREILFRCHWCYENRLDSR